MELQTLDLLKLQTGYMQQDLTTQALCAALGPLWQELGTLAWRALIYPRIDQLTGAALDAVAWGFHVDGYDTAADDAEKRRLIRSSFTVHKYKGTVYAVQQLVQSVFGGQARVQEWFEYGGSPYHFRVEVDCEQKGADAQAIGRVEQLVEAGKNLRSKLEEIQLYLTQTLSFELALAAQTSETITITDCRA